MTNIWRDHSAGFCTLQLSAIDLIHVLIGALLFFPALFQLLLFFHPSVISASQNSTAASCTTVAIETVTPPFCLDDQTARVFVCFKLSRSLTFM